MWINTVNWKIERGLPPVINSGLFLQKRKRRARRIVGVRFVLPFDSGNRGQPQTSPNLSLARQQDTHLEHRLQVLVVLEAVHVVLRLGLLLEARGCLIGGEDSRYTHRRTKQSSEQVKIKLWPSTYHTRAVRVSWLPRRDRHDTGDERGRFSRRELLPHLSRGGGGTSQGVGCSVAGCGVVWCGGMGWGLVGAGRE